MPAFSAKFDPREIASILGPGFYQGPEQMAKLKLGLSAYHSPISLNVLGQVRYTVMIIVYSLPS